MSPASHPFSWLMRPLRPPAATEKAPRDHALEGLRGLCAYAVLYAHALIPAPRVDPAYAPPHQFWWFDLGMPSVLIFFVLSGYVIGLTTTGPADAPGVRRYLLRRAWRLVPLNTAAIILTCLLWPHYDSGAVLTNLLFVQNHDSYPWIGPVPALDTNPVLWTLNYEVVYYLLFLVVWRWAPRLGTVLLVAALVVAAKCGQLFSEFALPGYAAGAFAWFGGLSLAWFTRPPERPSTHSAWVGALAGATVVWLIGPIRTFAYFWDLYAVLWPLGTSPHRWDFVLAAFWLVLAVTGRAPALQRRLGLLCLSLATGTWLMLFGFDAHALRETDWVALPLLLLSWALLSRPVSLEPLRRLAPLGGISFAVYLVGSPLQVWLCSLAPSFAGSALTFTVRLLLLVALTTLVAWWLERRFSPWLRLRFTPRVSTA